MSSSEERLALQEGRAPADAYGSAGNPPSVDVHTVADRWAQDWTTQLAPAPDLIVTLGDGAHLDALALRLPATRILSFAPAAPERRRGPHVRIERDPAPFAARLRRALLMRLEVYRALPPNELRPASPPAEELERVIVSERRAAQVELGTALTLGPLWFANLAANVPSILGQPSVASLMGSLRGRPVIVAGAGPSLETLLPALAEDRARFTLLAASSALRPLMMSGITPDAAVVIEPRDCSHHFADLPATWLSRLVLFAESSTHPAHLALPWGAVVMFHGPAGGWLAPYSGAGSMVPTGGNVGTTALVIAWMLGGFPVLSAGLDFARGGGRHYVEHAGSRADQRDAADLTEVVSWTGEPLTATPELDCYREQTELILRVIARSDPEARFLSLTSQGARVAGMQHVLWRRLAPHLPPDGTVGLVDRVGALAPPPGGAIAAHAEWTAAWAQLAAARDRWVAHPLDPRLGFVEHDDSPAAAPLLVAPAVLSAGDDVPGALERCLAPFAAVGAALETARAAADLSSTALSAPAAPDCARRSPR